MRWNREMALRAGQAMTRDGRLVVCLKEATLDGREVLTGLVVRPEDAGKRMPRLERMVWEAGGLGQHGGDDLVNLVARPRGDDCRDGLVLAEGRA